MLIERDGVYAIAASADGGQATRTDSAT